MNRSYQITYKSILDPKLHHNSSQIKNKLYINSSPYIIVRIALQFTMTYIF